MACEICYTGSPGSDGGPDRSAEECCGYAEMLDGKWGPRRSEYSDAQEARIIYRPGIGWIWWRDEVHGESDTYAEAVADVERAYEEQQESDAPDWRLREFLAARLLRAKKPSPREEIATLARIIGYAASKSDGSGDYELRSVLLSALNSVLWRLRELAVPGKKAFYVDDINRIANVLE